MPKTPRYFTHYWANETWDRLRSTQGEPLTHTAGGMFRKRGVGPGDFVYVITNLEGRVFLCGRMRVRRIVDLEEDRRKRDEVWEASDQVRGEGTPMTFEREVPDTVVRGLRFEPDATPVVFAEHGVDQQTLRGIRELTADSARLLDEVLADRGSQLRDRQRLRSDWTEAECYFAVWGYDQLDLARNREKATLYRELSELLGRTAKSVEFKIQNVSACDPRPRKQKAINEARHRQALLQQVFDDYWSDRGVARAREAEMREMLKFPSARLPRTRHRGSQQQLPAPIFIEEGLASEATSRTRSRSRQLLEMGRKHFRGLEPDAKLRCRACGYAAPDGVVDGREIVQLHHTRRLADADEVGHRLEMKEALEHLLPLCPNCHVLAHTTTPPLEIEVLRRLVRP